MGRLSHRRARLLALAGLVPAACGLLAVGVAPAGSAAAPTVFVGSADATGVAVGVTINDFLVVSQVVDGSGPSAQALVSGFGDSTAYGAYPYPGDLVLTAHGLSQGAVPDYPLIAQTSYPTRPRADVDQGAFHLQADSDASRSSALAAGGGSGSEPAVGATSSMAKVVHDDQTGSVTSDAETDVEAVSYASVLRIGRIHSRVKLVAVPGRGVQRTVETDVAQVSVAGQGVDLTGKGLVLPGTTVPLPADSAVNQTLSAAGVGVHYLAGYRAGTEVVSPGVAVTVTHDVPGAGPAVVTYTLGRVSASAVPGGSVGGSLTSGTVATVSAPAATGGGGAGPAAGSAGTIPGAAATGTLPATGAGVAPQSAGNAPQLAQAPSVPATLSRPMTSAPSFYAVLVLAALATISGALLFRILGVRLAWT